MKISNMKKSKVSKALFPLLFMAFGLEAHALLLDRQAISQTRCFVFEAESPLRQGILESETIVGCYLQIDQNRNMVFIKDQEGADKLSSILTVQGSEGFELIHFSQSAGETARVRQKPFTLNPLPVPATIEEALNSEGQEIVDLSIFSNRMVRQAREIFSALSEETSSEIKITDLTIPTPSITGIEKKVMADSYYLPPHKQPTDGYWWPHTNSPLANGAKSPLAKYDAYVEKLTGKNPNSVAWEKSNHFSDTIWSGHCNGWAAASILYGYDDVDLNDAANGNVITSSDIQGLRSETSYCVNTSFHGTRYWGDGDDQNDIYPEEFLRNLRYYILFLQKPVVIDYLSGTPVDSHIVSGYTISYERTSTPNKYLGKAKLRIHGYNYSPVTVRQIAKPYEKTYSFWMWKDSRGRVAKTKWVSHDHPDFMWIPLNESSCKGENPKVEHKYVEHMLKTLRPVRHRLP